MKKSLWIIIVIILVSILSFANAKNLNEKQNIHAPAEYSTIQEAIDASVDGDTIIVAPGTYQENINFKGKNIILRSEDPTDFGVRDNTIIDGGGAGSVVTFSGSELTSCVLSGFTLTNGYSEYGGGVNGHSALSTIENNIITSNSVVYHGGGIFNCSGMIRNNSIINNNAESGGGLYGCGGLFGKDGAIQENIISGNHAKLGGGGLSSCRNPVRNNLITDNSANYGAGLLDCDRAIHNNIITENHASHEGGALYLCDGSVVNNTIYHNQADKTGGGLSKCRGLIINSIIWANEAGDADNQISESSEPQWCCVEDWAGGGRNNIASDPQFDDPSARILHLSPGSPCIDAGNPYYLFGDYITDIDGETRLASVSVDIGADEYDSSPDSDGDLLSNDHETSYGTHLMISDSDNDGLKDGVEVLRGTDPSVPDMPSGVNIPTDYLSVQEGIFKAFEHENVTIQPGNYEENILLLGKNIILTGSAPATDTVVNNTVLDGEKMCSVITFSGSEKETCMVKGLTVKNGSSNFGGGIKCNAAMPVIENNAITTNTAHNGGGIHACFGIIRNNRIFNNHAENHGGGLSECEGKITGNAIFRNSAEDHGGGMSFCYGTIYNNEITQNESAMGGGLANCRNVIMNNKIARNKAEGGGGFYDCRGLIQNNFITGNTAEEYGGGIYDFEGMLINNTIWGNSAVEGGGIIYCEGIIRNCIIWNNTAMEKPQIEDDSSTPTYCCIQDWTGGGTGNITADPQFRDPANGDFHLNADSPCIDAGGFITDLDADFEGDIRPYDYPLASGGDGSNFDIGADEAFMEMSAKLVEYHILGKHDLPQSRLSEADANNDGVIDVADMIYFMK